MSTDTEWEKWGRQDPYFGVITDPRFRRDRLTAVDRNHFFETGRVHAQYVIDVTRQRLDPIFVPRRVLDFGCGVGRVLLPFARVAQRAVGVDVAESMLVEAQGNADAQGITNIDLMHQGDLAGIEPGTFDLVHSAIVLQHIDVQRGVGIFGQLLALLAPRGVGAVQVTYAKMAHAATLGIQPAQPEMSRQRSLLRRPSVRETVLPSPAAPGEDPIMQMNSYPLTPLLFQLQAAQIRSVYVEFTDHGGELGVFLFFQKP